MFRRTPAFPRPALPFAFLGVATIGFLAHACTEPNESAIKKDITGPQLAKSASCPAPCVEVEVTSSGSGPSQPIDGIVVTLWRGGQPGTGEAFHALTMNGGIATFPLSGEVGTDPVGFCAVARPLTDERDAAQFIPIEKGSSAELNIVPNDVGVFAPSAPYQASVSVSKNRSRVLNKSNLVSNCISWETTKDAPFTVDQNTALAVSMSMDDAPASIDITCLFPDDPGPDDTGPDDTGANCQSWTAIPLTGVPIPWEPDSTDPDKLPDGVQKGFLASVGLGSSTSPLINDGLAFDETYFVEVAQGEFSSSLMVTTSGASTAETAELATILCIVNDGSPDFFESEGEVTTGMDILPDVLDGYAAIDPLQTVQFKPDFGRVVIAFDYLDLGGDLTATLQMRARQGDLDDGLPTNINKTIQYDFATCPGSPQILSENTEDEIVVTTVCRDDPKAFNLKHVEIVASVPSERFIEWGINSVNGEKHPETAKNNASSALRPINQPDFGGFCPLEDSGFGLSNDPKIWGLQID